LNLGIEYLTYRKVKQLMESGYRRLIIPIGALEPHGPHLPLGTDNLIPLSLAREVAPEIKALIAPPIHYGVTNSLVGYAGSSRVDPETLKLFLMDIIKGFRLSGFKTFIIMNGHGGNIIPIKEALAKLWTEDAIRSIAIHWWIEVEGIKQEVFGEAGGHAGIDETAMIIATYPDIVEQLPEDELKNEIIVVSRGYETYPSAGTIILYKADEGSPKYNAELAKRFYDRVVAHIKKLLISLINRIERR